MAVWECDVPVGSVDVPVGELDGAGLIDRFQRLERERRRVEAGLAEVIAEVERRRLHRADGQTSPVGWCRAFARWSQGEAVARVRTARLVTALPEIGDALAAGTIGVAQVHELARAHANPRAGGQLGEASEILLDHARTLPFDDFRQTVGYWESLADQDGAHRAHEVSHRNRRAHLHLGDRQVWLDAAGGAVDGAQMREIFDRYCDAEYLTDWADARERLGEAATGSDLARTGRQRAWDALLRIFVDAASTPPGAQAPEPVLNVVADVHTVAEVLQALASQLGGDEHSEIALPQRPADPRLARCTTTTGVALPRSAIVEALLFGQVRRVVFESAGVPVDVGRKRRFFTAAMREALAMQTSTCVFAGCTQPVWRCQTDHTVDHRFGGITATHNGSLLCGHHNRIKNRGFTVWRDPGGVWHTYRPDGTEIRAT